MKTLHLDLFHALRSLRKNPGYALVAILLFALGIGANTAIFSVASSVLLRPLPYAQPDRLVVALHQGVSPVSPADFFDYQKSTHSFEQMGAAQTWGATMTVGDLREQIPGIRLTASTIDLLGVPPMLGRTFTAGNEHAGQSNVLLISHSLWKDRFGGDPGVVGRQVTLDQDSYTILGVMPPTFRFAPFWAIRAQMWAPLDLDKRIDDRDGRSLRVFARLKEGVSVEQAQSEMSAIAAHLAAQYPQSNAKLDISVVPLHEKVVSGARPTLLALLGTVGFVLLIACATVGNLMLSRSVARRREMAVRLAVGARRGDLIRNTMIEVLLLAAGGAAAGILLGSWAIDVLVNLLPEGRIPRQAELGFDRSALLFGCLAALASALLAGILPGWQATRTNLNTDLKEGGRANTQGVGRLQSQSLLVAAEVALSLLLMTGAGLMMRTMVALASLDAGFHPHGLMTMQVSVSGTGYDQPGRRASLFEQVRNHLAAMPGVESVSAVNHIPLGGDSWGIGYSIDGRPAPAPGEQSGAVYRVAMPGYFKTMQVSLLEGRDFNAFDNEKGAPVAIVNETLAKRQWPGQSPIGQSLHYGLTPEDRNVKRVVVGVVRDLRQRNWTTVPDDEIYLPYFQRPDSMGVSSYMTYVMRTSGDSAATLDRIVRELHAFNKNLSTSEAVTMDRVIAGDLWRQRLAAILMGAFAAVALVLAAAGIYGVIAHSMKQRTQEIGIRMALGAKPSDLIGLVLREGMMPVLAGVAIGFVGAILLTRFLETLLYGVEARDASTFVLIAVVLLASCAAAIVIPAAKAARIDPLAALRQD